MSEGLSELSIPQTPSLYGGLSHTNTSHGLHHHHCSQSPLAFPEYLVSLISSIVMMKESKLNLSGTPYCTSIYVNEFVPETSYPKHNYKYICPPLPSISTAGVKLEFVGWFISIIKPKYIVPIAKFEAFRALNLSTLESCWPDLK